MMAVAVGAAERRTPAVFLPDTAGVTRSSPNDAAARKRAIGSLRHFAMEASPQTIMHILVARGTIRR
ncbi:hypothetical protein V3H18_00740 [Methylocystis sp. 9N]|uniref:Uncharacterized protein n=1 Tax=Methylocystis borbori TaxID=3118750 RepID=A0ABU7XCD7_9HYPH